MQGLGYTIRVWFSGQLLTPLIYSLLLIAYSGFRMPPPLGQLIFSLVIPNILLISVWMALGIFATIQLSTHQSSLKPFLSLAGMSIPFAGLAMIHQISALMSYSGDYLPALAYAISTLIFIWLYPANLPADRS